MRKLYLFFAMIILLQSCFSYKPVAVDPKTMVIGQEYKIERQNKTTKAVYVQNADSAIVVLKDGQQERIMVKDITSARKKKFSLAKTLVWVPVSIIAISLLFIYGTGDYDSEKK